jgi:DHA1 family bicyclomycin/chloramphenicol resistance-like MFS transporter
LKQKFFTLFLVLLSAFGPLSTDFYLPALPTITAYYGVPEYQTNLTLTVFFAVLAVSTLICGPLSDKYGRKPILLVGMSCYLLGGILCSQAASIEQLILFRVLQAIGGGSATATASAIVKDVYPADKQGSVLAVVQAMVLLCPAIAPSIGAIVLNFTSWRGLFLVQAVLGVFAVVGTLLIREPLAERNVIGVFRTFGRLWLLLKNGDFTILLIAFSLPAIAGMCYITISPYIYQDYFGLSSQVYSYFFAAVAIGMVAGSLLYIVFSRHLSPNTLGILCFTLVLLFGAGLMLFGKSSPWIFTAIMLPASLFVVMSRPLGTLQILNLQKNDSGAASSLIGGFGLLAGSLGAAVISLFHDYIAAVGGIHLVSGLIGLILWLLVIRKRKRGLLTEQ